MALFSSCCSGSSDDDDDDDDQAARNPRDRATAAHRAAPEFRTIRYTDTIQGNPPTTGAYAASNDSAQSSQVSPRATPSRHSDSIQDLTSSTDSRDAPQTPVQTKGTTQDISPSVYSQPSRPQTAPNPSSVRHASQENGDAEAASAANASDPGQRTSDGEVSMDAIRKFMGDGEVRK